MSDILQVGLIRLSILFIKLYVLAFLVTLGSQAIHETFIRCVQSGMFYQLGDTYIIHFLSCRFLIAGATATSYQT